MTDALQKCGVPDPTATIVVELEVLAVNRAHARWADPASQQSFADIARLTLQELRAATATLD